MRAELCSKGWKLKWKTITRGVKDTAYSEVVKKPFLLCELEITNSDE